MTRFVCFVLILHGLMLGVGPGSLRAQSKGFYPKIGGLPTESGFALGVGYRKPELAGGLLDLQAEIIGSVKKYEQAEIQLQLPRLWRERLFAEVAIRYRNFPEENFWGLGADSERSRESNFRLEDLHYSGAFGFRPFHRVRVGMSGGLLYSNTGPGQDDCCPSIEERFSSTEAPALEQQPDYWHLGGFVQFDSRDQPTDPRSGANYMFRWTHYQDRDFGLFSFRRAELELQQFLPVIEKRGTFALRGLLWLTDVNRNQQAPFFMQPTVGGSQTLRGFRQSRFRDRNIVAGNLEYRWEFLPFLEGVAFADAGGVFRSADDFGWDKLEGSLGVGGRFKINERVWLGVDFAWGREGSRIWIRGSHTF